MAASRRWTRPFSICDHVDGVMLGRAAYHTPGMLAGADAVIFGRRAAEPSTGPALIETMAAYCARHIARRRPARRM